MSKKRTGIVYQFRIELLEIEPKIWRVIQVPSDYSFWDLHVAIQDAMGWLDCHLHAFNVRMPHMRTGAEIGIPDDEEFDRTVLPGWEVSITDYFTEPGKSARYDYDFGDGWSHRVLLEAIMLKEVGRKYPRCIAGERACPPEDCGGVDGYYELLKIIADPDHPEYEDYMEWLSRYKKKGRPYEPGTFNPEEVKFWNPKKRWEIAFSR
ncbi:MAG: Plasmid pRiA4b ORF-3-like protein [Syntrophus sp. PtaU1.Bin208]|nr:MAG: Plasmid pRiA4b ORF-3-like protein [Syntrophus sp. PtaU1.Bin208]